MKIETSHHVGGESELLVKPAVASREQLVLLLDLQSRRWPFGLSRFTPFKRARDLESVRYRAICWNAYTETLIVLRANPHVTPDGVGDILHWDLKGGAEELKDIQIVADTFTPIEIRGPTHELRPSSLVGMTERDMLLRAVLYLAPYEGARRHEWIFNDAYFFDDEVRIDALTRVCIQFGRGRGFQTQLREYVHKYIAFGGSNNAMAKLTCRRGGPGKRRIGINKRRPGRRTSVERRETTREVVTGIRVQRKRQLPLRPQDESKILDSLWRRYGLERESIIEAYRDCLRVHYRKWPLHLVPTERMFRVCAKSLIKAYDIENLRLGTTLSRQHNKARAGSASELTQGVIDIVDVDGFVAKVGIAALVNGKIESVHVVIVFAVSRLSGAVLGWELRIDQEKGEAFRRCIASVFLSKKNRAHELGLSSAKGLLHGNIDGVFVDNGAGASKKVIASAVSEMGLLHAIAPPARGDYKGVGEGLNGIMIRLLLVLDSAYTRATDRVAKARARQAALAKPVPLLVFEKLLWQSIAYYNRYTNKRRLRTVEMRKRRVQITPEALHRWTQKQRFGDARRILAEWQVYERFVPWIQRVCSNGSVVYMDRRFSAPELKAFFDDHRKARRPGKCVVDVKRLDGPSNILKWRTLDGAIVDLKMIAEDEARTGDLAATWMEVELQNMDDAPQSGVQSQKLKRKGNANRVTVEQDASVSATERNRALLGGLEGNSMAVAKANARKQRDEADQQREAQAYGLTSDDSAPPAPEVPVSLPFTESSEEEELFRSLGL